MRFRYFDPAQQSTVEGDVQSRADATELIGLVIRLPGSHVPAVEFLGHDGSSLLIGISGPRAVLLFTAADGRTTHSLAESCADLMGEGVVFDCFGAYTEMPASYCIATGAAVAAAGDYVETSGTPALLLAVDA